MKELTLVMLAILLMIINSEARTTGSVAKESNENSYTTDNGLEISTINLDFGVYEPDNGNVSDTIRIKNKGVNNISFNLVDTFDSPFFIESNVSNYELTPGDETFIVVCADTHSEKNKYKSGFTIEEAGNKIMFNAAITIDKASKILTGRFSDDIIFNIYPNYIENEEAKIDFEVENEGKVVVRVFEINGRLKHVENLGFKNEGKYTQNIDFRDFPKGMYFLSLNIGEEYNSKRIFITN